ncbi:MAG: hypothetical protein COB38_12940 [Gammaproteobacteria bacterium]|nr:MAG: hypothetical protein COB38_12940 [Gammaproteobacteria bacterium]
MFNKIWLSATNLGLYYFDLSTSIWQRPAWLPKEKSPLFINQLYYDNNDNIWIGSLSEGIIRYNFTSKKLSSYKNTKNKTILSGNWIKSFLQDSSGDIWVGSSQGLMKYQAETDSFQFLSLREDGTKDTIYGLLQDDNDFIWASTNQGLVRFHPNSFDNTNSFDNSHSLISVRHFNHNDGLQGNEFNTGAFLKAKDGTFYFGGTNGFNSFNPLDFIDDSIVNSPVISELKIFNQSVSVNETSDTTDKYKFTLPQPIHMISELNLSYQHQLFSLAFSAMNYDNASQQIYAYRLIGLFDNWIETDSRSRIATFSGLPPGNYQFQVKSKTSGESWNLNSRNDNITELSINISPPWWMSYYAYFVYLFILVMIPYLFFHQRSKLIRIRAIDLEKEVKLRTSQLKTALIQKEEVFTNISHEFRTPLTLMIGPAEELTNSQYHNDIKRTGDRIKRNGELLLRLVNQLLGIARSEQEEIDEPHNILDLSQLVEHICQRFDVYASSTQIKFSYQIKNNILINATAEQIEPIISNILSNAFKYTPDKGTIKLKLFQRNKKISCEISDNGQGIATNELDKIFDRFYRSSNNKENNQSSGIGLALVKALVNKTNGKIEVFSSLEKGTQFLVRWNDVINHSMTATIQRSKDLVNTTYTEKEISILNFPHYQPQNKPLDKTKPCLLIVEDHNELKEYLISRLSTDYACLSASNGEQGVEFAIKHQPKVIISDIMMPKLDGYGLCEKIKTNHITSHIPIILLTAKADKTSRIKGLIKEANIYLSKPFDFNELSLHIRNLLNERENLKKQFCIALDNDHWDTVDLPKEDDDFLNSLNNAMNAHYSEQDFQATELAKIIGFSERQLQRKFKAFSGITPTHFMRQWRLNQSRRLLLQRHPIGNIALDCGFSSQAYFGKCFKQQFSMTPSEYLDLKTRQLDS